MKRGIAMSTILMNKKEEYVMKLVHYFVTEKNYTPIVVNGVKNEIWLENNDGPYKIVRINSNYIHNAEQYNYDLFKTKSIVKQIKKKTLTLRMNVLNIFLDLNDSVKAEPEKDISPIVVNDQKDLSNNQIIVEAFPDIKSKLLDKSDGVDLIINVTNDINKKTTEENRKYENVFKPKKIIVTNIIISFCVIIFALSYLYPNIFNLGLNYGPYVRSGQYYRLITCTFLHAGIIHLFCNMYTLFIIGSQLETYIGRGRFTFVYIVSALTGSLMSIIFSTNPSVGASGAIFGLMGSLLYFGYHYRLYLGSVIRSQIIPLILLNLFIGFTNPQIDSMAHVGGLIGGYLATMAIGIQNKTTKNERINGWIVLILYIAFMIYMGIIH